MVDTGNALFSTKEAAAYLTVQPETLEAWRYRGVGLRFIKIGHLVRYRKIDLDGFIEKGFTRSNDERES
jgi:excisionase family DNA binding protein